jgi:CheY-like chemotaxis protein
MNEETKEHIFAPFFTTKEVGKGTGLGLATVYGIVRQHNGYITIDSEPNQGTTFRIYFPAVKMKASEEQDTTTTDSTTGQETILIAEDDAIETFKQHQAADLIIIDSVMPKKNGREVYEEIRSIDPHVKALFTSGYTKDIVLDKGIRDKEFDFIAKPLSLNMLLQKVHEVLDK